MVRLTVNGKDHDLDVPDEMPLLWAIRDVDRVDGHEVRLRHRRLRRVYGTRRRGADGAFVRACASSTAVGKKITTIEGLAPDR
jgi:isoquinoline 1-oxidoreductase alpha subunit